MHDITIFKEVLGIEIPIKRNNKDSLKSKIKNSERALKKPNQLSVRLIIGKKITKITLSIVI